MDFPAFGTRAVPFVAGLAVSLLAARLDAQAPAARADSAGRRLSLLEALDVAEGESETVGLARADVARARGDRRRARSGYFPQLTGAASYQRTLRSQFSVLEGDGSADTTTTPSRECARFTPVPGMTVEERLDSLESAVECASAFDPFSSVRNLPFGRENTYRFGLSLSQTLFSGGQVSGRSRPDRLRDSRRLPHLGAIEIRAARRAHRRAPDGDAGRWARGVARPRSRRGAIPLPLPTPPV